MRLRRHRRQYGIFRRFEFRVLALIQVLGLANLVHWLWSNRCLFCKWITCSTAGPGLEGELPPFARGLSNIKPVNSNGFTLRSRQSKRPQNTQEANSLCNLSNLSFFVFLMDGVCAPIRLATHLLWRTRRQWIVSWGLVHIWFKKFRICTI